MPRIPVHRDEEKAINLEHGGRMVISVAYTEYPPTFFEDVARLLWYFIEGMWKYLKTLYRGPP